jgi:hypothetical protein
MDIAVVGCAVNLRLQAATVTEARVALGGGRPDRRLLSDAAAQAIIGTPWTMPRWPRWPAVRARATPITTSAERRNSAPMWRAFWPARGEDRLCRAEEKRNEQDSRHHHRQRRSGRIPGRPARDAARCAARPSGPDRHPRKAAAPAIAGPVRSCGRHAGLLLPVLAAEAEGATVETIEGLAQGKTCTPCSASSSNTRRCNAASARRAFWSRPRRCWSGTRTRRGPRCATGWRATCAAAPAMTRSSAPCMDAAAEMRGAA